ncbi:hypothetical protein HHI36_008500 [Cryptolaemus montrouzieri]|uniref:Uncharacterized protein n=1 Tax=Cryptolaemus montrouzieri TaxID=559131 RepID=A0ABD2MSN7_9CUCU
MWLDCLVRLMKKAATMTNSVNGFRKAGLFPCNRHIFTDEEFSIFNDGDEEQDLLNVQRNDENADLEDTSCVLTSIENQSEPTEILPNSGITNDNPSDEYQGLASSKTASTASVYDNPVPSTSSSVSPKTRTGAASIITASPYKKSLEESLNKKQEKKIRKDRRNNQLKTADKEKNPIKKKKAEEVSSSSEDDDMPELADSSGDEYDAECPYCSGNFSQDTRGEKWAKCDSCFKWAHEDCGDVASNRFCVHYV